MSEVLERMERLHKTEEARILREKNKAKREFVERFICSPLAVAMLDQIYLNQPNNQKTMDALLLENAKFLYDAIEKHFSGEEK